jgi:O-antigen/teichoic acid export membrane protein/glycosyltransferase involved in cell wall biosynthesis
VVNKLSSHWPISLTNGAAALFNLFLPLALVRIIPPDQVGRYKIFFLYVMLSPGLFLVGGLSNGLYHWAGRYPATKQEIQQSWTWLLGMGLILSLLGLALAPFLADLLKMPRHDLEIFLCYVPFGLACSFIEDLFISRGEIWKGSLYGSGFHVLRAGAALAAAYWGRRVEYVLWAFFGITLLRAVVGWSLARKSGDIQLVFSKIKSKEVLRYALPVSIAAFSGVALANVDQLILSFRLHPAEFAFYAMGCLTVPPLQILEMSVNRILIPNLSKAFASQQYKAVAAMYSEAVSELFRFLLPATVGLILFAHPIIRILFTDRYAEAAQYLEFYALVYLFIAFPYDAVARAMGDGVWILRLALFLAPLSIAATWFAASRWGAMGALMAFLATQLSLRLYALVNQKRRLGIPYSQFLPLQDMLQLTAWALFIGFGAWLFRPAFSDDKLWFVVMGPIFTLMYFAGAYGFILKSSNPLGGPIHVLELVQYLSVGGLERMVYLLSRGLRQTDRFRPMVAMYDRLEDHAASSLVPQFAETGIPVFQWKKGSGFSPRLVAQLVRVIFSQRSHVLHAHDLGPLIYGSLAKCFALGRVQLVFTLHTLLHVQQSARYRFYFKYFLRYADRIVVVSPAVKAGLLSLGVDPRHIQIVPNGVSFSVPFAEADEKRAFRRKLIPDIPSAMYEGRWILSLARLHAGKGQDVALDVWQALPPEIRKETVLFLVGPHTEKDFVRTLLGRMEGLPDADRIFLPGPTHRPDDWLRAADIFFSGSQHEGMPLAPLEAAGSGLPTLLTDIPGHEFLKPWGRFFSLRKPHEAAAHLVELIDTMKKQGEKAFFDAYWQETRSLRDTWSETAMVASYMNVFQSLWDVPQSGAQKTAYAAPSS